MTLSCQRHCRGIECLFLHNRGDERLFEDSRKVHDLRTVSNSLNSSTTNGAMTSITCFMQHGRLNWVSRRKLFRQSSNSVDDVISRQRRETLQGRARSHMAERRRRRVAGIHSHAGNFLSEKLIERFDVDSSALGYYTAAAKQVVDQPP